MSASGIRSSLQISLFGLCIAASILIICSCGGMNSMNTNRMLLSMSISPANANAQNSPNGQVMFTAMGNFSQPPSPAMVPFTPPFTGSWFVSNSSIAAIDQNGMAQCVAGQSGTVTVGATVSANTAGPGAMSTAVSATTTLTCP